MIAATTRPATLVWFRQDLRLADHPALHAAIKSGGPIIPVFIWAPEEEGDWAPGGASRWWLHQSLRQLAADLAARGSRLILRTGPSLRTLQELVATTGATSVQWHRRYEPAACARDATIKETLRAAGLNAESHNGNLLFEPWTIANKSAKPFQVFTPFWRTCLAAAAPPVPLATPRTLIPPGVWPESLPLTALQLEPTRDWAAGFRTAWTPGETGAAARLASFITSAFATYGDQRNRPDVPGTSRLSPHLHWGEISPRQIWHALEKHAARQALPATVWRGSQFLAEVGWREFAHHLLFHFPHTATQPLRAEFTRFPWRDHPGWLKAWQRGRTGYPIVDAGLRELWHTGWMHNRVRMIVASFLVKDLLLPWQAGARWFWDTLVDADLAGNTLGWQWTAGCGADAAPYFRVFNPVSQGEKFDPQGDYVRRWVPELGRLPAQWIHQPSVAPADVLRQAGVALGANYPEPVVSHAIAREVALEAYRRARGKPAK